MRTSWSPLAWSKSVAKDQDTPKPKVLGSASLSLSTPKPKAIPEDYVLGGYEGETVGCTTSRTDNTDVDACSPYHAKLVSGANDSSTLVALQACALTSRTDDTDDDGTPCTKRRFTRCSTRDLVDMVDQRTQEVERLLEVGNAIVTDKQPKDSEFSPCKSSRVNGSESLKWENLHDQANACLADIHDRLVTMAEESASDNDNASVKEWHEASDDSNVAVEVQELRRVVDTLVAELSEVKEGEAAMKKEITMLRERLARVDRQAARWSDDVQEVRQEQRSGPQKACTESPSLTHNAAPQPEEPAKARKPPVPKFHFAASSCSPTSTTATTATTTTTTTSDIGKPQIPLLKFPGKPQIPLLKLPGSTSKQPKQLAGSHSRMQQRGATHSTQPSRPFMGQNFFRK